MAKNHVALATLLSVETMAKNGPFGVPCATGALDGFPIAAAWITKDRSSRVGIVVRFRRGSLSIPAETVRGSIESSEAILAAMRRKKLSVFPDGISFTWPYSFRAPKPENVAAVVRALVAIAASAAKPVGNLCEKCDRQSGELYSIDGALLNICSGCREQAGEEDRVKIQAYELRESRSLAGVLAGVAAAAVMAVAWGLVAYTLNRIFLFGAAAIGVAIAWAVNRASGKVTSFGRGITVVLTIGAVVAGDFLFVLLSAAKQFNRPIDASLLAGVARVFIEIEFFQSSGWMSLFVALIGAAYILFVNRPPVSKRRMTPVRPVLTTAYKPIE
jgi:hypothetical protein